MIKCAVFSSCQHYRYSLSRIWDTSKDFVLFIGLNPSIATANEDDPTVVKLSSYCLSWDFGGFKICNLFAYRSPNFKDLLKIEDPVGLLNDFFIDSLITESKFVVLMWGNQGLYRERNRIILEKIVKPKCFKQNKNGSPAHPLYLSNQIKPVAFNKALLEC